VASNILLQTCVLNCFLIFTYKNVCVHKEAVVLHAVLKRNAGGRYLPIFVSLCAIWEWYGRAVLKYVHSHGCQLHL